MRQIRLHKCNDTLSKHRPLRFKVRQFESKLEILQANSVLKNHDEEEKKKIFMTPDLTQKQREQSFRLREELRYRKNVLGHTNLKISKGRIVSSVHGRDSTWPTEDGYDGRTFDREYRNRTFVNRNRLGKSLKPTIIASFSYNSFKRLANWSLWDMFFGNTFKSLRVAPPPFYNTHENIRLMSTVSFIL